MVKNSDLFSAHLNVTFDYLDGGLEAYDSNFNIDFVLSPDLWQKWESTGKEGEGISIIAPHIARITNPTTAKLKNIPFEASEASALGLRAVATSGKVENAPLHNFAFKISHEATNPIQTIKQPSACLFRVSTHNNQPTWDNPTLSNHSLRVYPNPFAQDFTVDFGVEAAAISANIKIYDINGRQVGEIAEQRTYEVGNHKVYFDTTLLAKGVYLVVLQTNRYKRVAKIIKM